MRVKSENRLIAEKLRIEQGLSYKEIQAITGVSKSTLSGWLKEIPLSPESQERIRERIKKNQTEFVEKAWQVNRDRYVKARQQAYGVGEAIAERLPADPTVEELALAMLYLGEGSKSGGRVQMASIDPGILKYFIHSLASLYKIELNMLTFRLNLIPAARSLEGSFQKWWLEQLGCPEGRFQATQYDRRSGDRPITGNYHGVCTVTLNHTLLQQRLLGLAQQYILIKAQESGIR